MRGSSYIVLGFEWKAFCVITHKGLADSVYKDKFYDKNAFFYDDSL